MIDTYVHAVERGRAFVYSFVCTSSEESGHSQIIAENPAVIASQADWIRAKTSRLHAYSLCYN